MAKKYDDVGGVWRTIGGRRVFIKDGQDLTSAMKESGKFKAEKDKQVKKLKKENEKLYKEYNGFREINEDEEVKKAYKKWKENAREANELQLQYKDYEPRKWEYEKDMPEGAKFSKMLEESGVKTFADEIKESEEYEQAKKEYDFRNNELIHVYDKKYGGNRQEKEIAKQYMNQAIRKLNNVYENMYKEYLKENPNSKMTLKEFRIMIEKNK